MIGTLLPSYKESLTMSSYFRVRLSQVPDVLEAEVTQLAFQRGANGVSEALQFIQPDLTYDPRIIHRRAKDLDVFFTEPISPDFYKDLQEHCPALTWQVYEEENRDWLEEWKKGFEPFCLVGPYWVVPSWLQAPPECQFPISIDPGMAFGTGTHATTKMAAHFVYKITQEFKDHLANWSFLDVGTGTGILAMLAKRAGLGQVLGIEIDAEARRVARDNLRINNLHEDIEISDLQIEEISKENAIVVANIVDGVLIQIRKELLKAVKPGGHLFLTGILLEREDHFLEKFIEKSNLQVHRRLENEDWVGYWVQKKF